MRCENVVYVAKALYFEVILITSVKCRCCKEYWEQLGCDARTEFMLHFERCWTKIPQICNRLTNPKHKSKVLFT